MGRGTCLGRPLNLKTPCRSVVEGQGNSPAPDQPVHQDEVAPGILSLPEDGVGDNTGGIVHCQQQDETRSPLLQPRMVAAVDLDQHSGPGHPLPPDPVLGWATPPGTGQAGLGENAAHRLPAEIDALPFPQQLCEMGMIGTCVVSADQVRHCRRQLIRHGVWWAPAPAAVGQSGGSLLAICRQNAPSVAFGDAQKLGGLVHR